jgi:hypothetical protein
MQLRHCGLELLPLLQKLLDGQRCENGEGAGGGRDRAGIRSREISVRGVS